MANTNKAPLARRPATPPNAPKPAPSPAQQAARERFVAMVQSRPSTPAAPAKKPAPRSLAAKVKPQKETIGSVVGGVVPTMAAGVGLGFANGTKFGKKLKDDYRVKPSLIAGVVAIGAKALGVDALSPTAGKICNEVIRSEGNATARDVGEYLAEKLSAFGEGKTEEKAETKTEEKAETKAPETNGIEVKEISKSNGAPTVTHAPEQAAAQRAARA